mgnify:CR=1 FL=1
MAEKISNKQKTQSSTNIEVIKPGNSQIEKINFINERFMISSTVEQLHGMMKEVTKKEISPATVNAACNCVARLNETITTAIQAAKFLNEK